MKIVYIGIILAFAAFGNINADSGDCNTPTTSECSAATLACCDKKFREALSVADTCESSPLYVNPECLRNEIENIYADGNVDGIFKVCSAFYNFQNCLGNTFKDCTSARWNIRHNTAYNIAELYATIFAQFNFACGAGLDTYINEDQCMSGIFGTNSTQLRNCRDEFYSNTVANPALKCFYLDQLTACYEKPFKDLCGVEAGWWGCEYERIGISLFYPECSPKCTVYQEINYGRNVN